MDNSPTVIKDEDLPTVEDLAAPKEEAKNGTWLTQWGYMRQNGTIYWSGGSEEVVRHIATLRGARLFRRGVFHSLPREVPNVS